jgi:hypothetical protein
MLHREGIAMDEVMLNGMIATFGPLSAECGVFNGYSAANPPGNTFRIFRVGS